MVHPQNKCASQKPHVIVNQAVEEDLISRNKIPSLGNSFNGKGFEIKMKDINDLLSLGFINNWKIYSLVCQETRKKTNK